MEILLRTHGPGVHCYLPFRSNINRAIRELSSLQDLCKNSILKCITLRRLLQNGKHLDLPTYLIRYLTTLTTADFEEIECAPFVDAFSLNFFHRALTYRVLCFLDEQEYMATLGYCPTEVTRTDSFHQNWIDVQHENIMCVCGLVVDPVTNNIFYLFDQPKVSLVQIYRILMVKNIFFPEVLLWQLVINLTSALQYILSRGLRYGKFGLDNIFVVKGKVVLENGLTRKSWKSKTPITMLQKSPFYDADDPEQETLICLKNVIIKLTTADCIGFYSTSTRDLLIGESWPSSLDHMITIGNKIWISFEENISFADLVNTLQHSVNEE